MGGGQSSPAGGGGVGSVAQAPCMNGVLRVGSRVQTQYTREEGGDDRWYSGTITTVFANEHATIRYDDGDVWTGATCYIRLLNPGPGAGLTSPPGMQILTAVVPPGAVPGQPISVPGPGGVPYTVAVPQGALPGQQFQCHVAAPPRPDQYGAGSSTHVVQAVPVMSGAAPTVVQGQPVMAQAVGHKC